MWRRTSGATPGEEVVEFSGRICYMSFGSSQSPRSNADYIMNLIQRKHDSVLEHAVWTFLLTGVTRAFTHQLVRHRVGMSFSQLSQQYHDETSATFILPPALADQTQLIATYVASVQSAQSAYSQILEALASRDEDTSPEARRSLRSAARGVLPESTETKIVVTANARSLRHFLALRGDIKGDIEMRLVSKRVFEMVSGDSPALFPDFILGRYPDGSPSVRQVDSSVRQEKG